MWRSRMNLPGWLLAHLAQRGLDNPDGVTRAARLGRCRGCGRAVLRGLDADRCALPAECDTEEIDARGELVALAIGLRTYTLTRAANSGWNIDPRYPAAIASGRRTPIVNEHRCGFAIPSAAAPRLHPAAAVPSDDDACPF